MLAPLLLAVLLLAPALASAQMTISGQVVTSAGAAVQGASVSIPFLNISTRTAADGRYAFIIRQAQVMGQQVNMTARHGRFGAQTVQIRIVGGSLEQNFVLGAARPADTLPAGRVPPPVEQRAPTGSAPPAMPPRVVRYPGLIVGFESVVAGPVDFVSSLAGRHASLLVNAATTPDGSASMLYRGARSFMGNTQPLIVLDGVPLDNQGFTTPAQRFGLGGFDFGSPLNDLPLDEIATVDLLDPATAALRYGSRAANGVLDVRTKSDGITTGLAISARARVSGQRVTGLPAFQHEFGQGSGGQYEFFDGQGGGINDAVAESWGPRLDARPIIQHSLTEPRRPDVRYWLPQPDDIERFYEGASSTDASVALSGARPGSSFRMALDTRTAAGPTPGSHMRRLGARASGGTRVADRLAASLHAQLTGTFANQRPGTGFDEVNPAAYFTRMGRQVDLDALRANVTAPSGEQINWIYTDRNNPWFAPMSNTNESDRRHFIAGLSLGYSVSQWLTATLGAGTDDWTETRLIDVSDAWVGTFPTTAGRRDFSQGGSDDQTVGATESALSFGLNARQRDTTGFRLAGALGAELRKADFHIATIVADNTAGDVISSSRDGSHDVTAFMLSGSSARGALSVEAGARVEQSSSLPQSYSAIYPSAQLTYDVARALPALREALRMGDSRLVARWWRAGSEVTERTLAGAFYGGAIAFPDSAVNGPERTQGIELGMLATSPAQRIGVDIVAYRERSTSVLATVLPGDGTARLTQVGEIFNGGVHALVGGSLLQDWRGMDAGFRLGLARNWSTVDVVSPGASQALLSPSLSGAVLGTRVGSGAVVIMGSRYLRAADGTLVLRNGLPVADANAPLSVLGSVHPDWTATLDTRWSYRGVQLYLLLDARTGGKVFSATNMWGSRAGTLENTLIGDRAPGAGAADSLTIAGTDSVTGAPNTTRVSAEQYFHALGDITEPWVYDAGFTRLREARISYQVPTRFIPGFREHSLRVSLVGRNLLTSSVAPNFDPGAALGGGWGFEMGQLPTTRSFGLQVTIAP